MNKGTFCISQGCSLIGNRILSYRTKCPLSVFITYPTHAPRVQISIREYDIGSCTDICGCCFMERSMEMKPTFAPKLSGHPARSVVGVPRLPAVLRRIVAVHWEHICLVVSCTLQHHLCTCLCTTCRESNHTANVFSTKLHHLFQLQASYSSHDHWTSTASLPYC